MIMREIDIWSYFDSLCNGNGSYCEVATIDHFVDSSQENQSFNISGFSRVFRFNNGKTYIVNPCFQSIGYEYFVTVDEFFGLI